MRYLFFITLIFLLGGSLTAQENESLIHNTPEPVILGENASFELNNSNAQNNIYEPTLFYRLEGQQNFKSLKMNVQGFIYTAEVPAAQLRAGNLEYYFAWQNAFRQTIFLPAGNPESNPFRVKVLPAKSGEMFGDQELELQLLTPEPGESMIADDFVIAIGLPLDISQPEKLTYRLLIDGINVSKLVTVEGNLVLFDPKTIKSGPHNAEFKVLDNSGRIIGKLEWPFRISGLPTNTKALSTRSEVFLDNRVQTISEENQGFFRGGVRLNGNYARFDFGLRALISSEESFDRQPVNQYGLELRYNFSPRTNIYLKGGDYYTNYDPLVFWEKRVRGAGMGLVTPYFNLDVSLGQTARSVEGKAVNDSVETYGTYAQSFLAVRPEFKFGSHVNWGLNLVNAKDDPGSIDYGANPKEALVLGTSLDLNFDSRRVQVLSSVQASIANNDAEGTVDFDSLADQFDLSGSEKDMAEQVVNFFESTGFLTLSQGLSPIPNLAYNAELRLNYFNNQFSLAYKNIDADFASPGNPFLLKDIRGLFISDNIRLLNNQVFLNLYFKNFDDNFSEDQYKSGNSDLGAILSYYPMRNLPSVTLSFGSQSRKNDLNPNSQDSLLAEDNSLQRIGISTSYDFPLGGLENTATFSVTNLQREDAIDDQNNSSFNVFSVGIRNKFSFPLTTRLSFTQSASVLGEGDIESNSDIQKFFAGAEYKLKNAILNSDLQPYARFTMQSFATTRNGDYQRSNYTAGVQLMNQKYGNLSLRFDYICFGDLHDWSDTIFSTRYDVSF